MALQTRLRAYRTLASPASSLLPYPPTLEVLAPSCADAPVDIGVLCLAAGGTHTQRACEPGRRGAQVMQRVGPAPNVPALSSRMHGSRSAPLKDVALGGVDDGTPRVGAA